MIDQNQFHRSILAPLILALVLAGCAPAADSTTPTGPPAPTSVLATASAATLTPTPPATEPAPTAVSPTATWLAATATATQPPEGRGNADVLHVRAVEANDGTWTFHVTVEHPDTGWEDYADGWDVVTLDGEVLKRTADDPFTRLLLHPHENEQPFTRSQSGIPIPLGVTQVRVRAHDLVDGYGGREVVVDLTAPSGPDFEVERVSES